MDPHVRQMAVVLEKLRDEVDGELYESVSYDEGGRPCEITPALKADVGGHLVNIVLFDVPGDKDHFSIIINATAPFSLHIRREARWDWVLKSFGQVEDHVIGVPDFDRKYLLSGQPEREVVTFLQDNENRLRIETLGPFLHLTASAGFVRASWPLTPHVGCTLDDLRNRLQSLLRLSDRMLKR